MRAASGPTPPRIFAGDNSLFLGLTSHRPRGLREVPPLCRITSFILFYPGLSYPVKPGEISAAEVLRPSW
jgi:hypothetical protein